MICGDARDLVDLPKGACKWPIGRDPHPLEDASRRLFCGDPAKPGAPYCGPHCQVAYGRKETN